MSWLANALATVVVVAMCWHIWAADPWARLQHDLREAREAVAQVRALGEVR